jgi:hypothetical protein
MVIKGNARGGAADLARHLQRRDTNERVEILQLRGVAANDLTGALREMDAYGAALRTTRTLYHASINVPAHERMTSEQRAQAIDRLESALGLTGQPRVVVEHEKHGRGGDVRVHCHIVWSRTDLEHMRAIRCDHNFRTHELVARELEQDFGHQRVQGVHVERDGPNGERIKRPERTPSHAMMQQAERSGRDPRGVKAEVTGLWQRTDSGKAFAAALEERGYTLCPGDRRDFVIVDRQGEVYSLAKCVDGARAKDVRARMADIDRGSLLSIADARAALRDAARAQRAEQQIKTRPLNPIEQRVDRAMRSGKTGQEFRDALGAEGAMLARVTEKDVQAFAAMRQENALKAAMRPDQVLSRVPQAERGEIVAVTRRGNVYRLNPQQLDQAKLEQCVGRQPPGVAEAREAWSIARGHAAHQREDRTADRVAQSAAFEAGRARQTATRAAERETQGAIGTAREGLGKASNALGRGIGAVAGAVLSFLDSAISPPKPPTRAEVEQSKRAETEHERQAAFRAHVAEIAQRQSSITDEARGKQREREQESRDQALREYHKREEDGRTR